MSKSKESSHVLQIIGVPKEAVYGTVRITMSEDTTKEEIDLVIAELKKNILGLEKANRLL